MSNISTTELFHFLMMDKHGIHFQSTNYNVIITDRKNKPLMSLIRGEELETLNITYKIKPRKTL